MREFLVAPLVVYGVLIGLLSIWSLSNKAEQKLDQMIEMEDTLHMIVGDDLHAQKKLLINVQRGVTVLYTVFSLGSLYVLLYDTVGSGIALSLLTIELLEHLMQVRMIKRASSIHEIPYKSSVFRFTSMMHLIGVAAIIGIML
jgi:hypothetical protein